jgi:flavin reductase (DIM6/NTAB) family NADH-FMN oxidoreductase RutF
MPDGSNTMHSETTFIPGPDNQRALRDALGCFATGVTVVTCRDAQGPLAMTANSFAGVSLDPAIVLWSPALTSARHDSFVAAEHFVIHIMSTAQKDLCTHFALNGRGFDDVAWSENAQGVPVLPDCVARFTCTRFATHPGGDHTVILGKVTEAARSDGAAPLVFAQGTYGRVAHDT